MKTAEIMVRLAATYVPPEWAFMEQIAKRLNGE